MKPPRPNASSAAGGFTLIELLVVLVILGLIMGIAVPQVLRYLGSARSDTARLQIQALSSALDLYRLDNGHYPQAISALVEPPQADPRWNGPYVQKKDMLLDPWSRPYRYRFPGEHAAFDLYTLGADNAPGGTGENQDLVNW